jgi:S1-C subfamily serine protease
MKNLWIALLAANASLAQGQLNQGPITDETLEAAKQLTVMINATIDGDTRPGAGIIFGLANQQVYIATTNHLVRRGLSKAGEIEVEFHWLPGQPLPAQLLTYYDDRALDLAVIVVDSAKLRLGPAGLPANRFGDPALLTRGAPVTAIGYPSGSAYDVTAAQISQVEAILLKYRVPGLVPGGYSGGPLVNRDGMIVGMIRQDQPPDGEATRMDLVVNQLKAWNYQVRAQDPRAQPETSKQPASSDGSGFRDTLLKYIAEAPSGFRSLGQLPGRWSCKRAVHRMRFIPNEV